MRTRLKGYLQAAIRVTAALLVASWLVILALVLQTTGLPAEGLFAAPTEAIPPAATSLPIPQIQTNTQVAPP